jgi:2-polyprenyl-3-methyl-5-hydroxy-6-metoxy-1,4-benzoquinol methylase
LAIAWLGLRDAVPEAWRERPVTHDDLTQRIARFTGGNAAEWTVAVVDDAADLDAQAFAARFGNVHTPLLLVADVTKAGVSRDAVDRVAIAGGFRRHARLFDAVEYAEIERETGSILVPLERVASDHAAEELEWLAQSRDLHMDMTREAGRRSDAHLARYAFASAHFPASGRVLDAACGLGYGAALISRASAGREVLGIDIDPASVAYARRHFGGDNRVAFETYDVLDLSRLPAASFDAIASFETVEHVADAAQLLRELHRVAKPNATIIASVPYRWFVGSDLGPYHLDWYDATKLIRLFSRFFVVDGMWRQTAGGGAFCADEPRGWQRIAALGAEPIDPAEWLVIVARRAELRPQPKANDWVFLAPGVPQLATMLAAMRQRKIDPARVTVWGCSQVADDGFHEAMSESAAAFGCGYAGNVFVEPDLATVGDPLQFAPDAGEGRDTVPSRIANAYPILESLRGTRLMMTARSNMPSDYVLVAGAQPRELHLVADGIQNQLIVRDFKNAAGFVNNELASLPTTADIGCPPWLETETAAIGEAAVLPERTCRGILARIGEIAAVSMLAHELSDRKRPFTGVIVSQHLSRAALTDAGVELVFYLHQIRTLLKLTRGRVLFKAHPRDPHDKLRALEAALGEEASRVRFTHGAENHAPLESFPQLANGRHTLLVWGTSSTALLGVSGWRRAKVSCVAADYIEAEVRRQAIQFSRRHDFALVTLRYDDAILGDDERANLRRAMRRSTDAEMVVLRASHAALEKERQQLWRDIAWWNGERERVTKEVEAERAYSADLRAQLENERHQAALRRAAGLESFLMLVAGYKRPLAIWGAGAGGQRVRALLEARVAAFVDSDPKKAGSSIDGVPVVVPAQLQHDDLSNAFVIVASTHAQAISAQLRGLGKKQGTDFVAIDVNDIDALEQARSTVAHGE